MAVACPAPPDTGPDHLTDHDPGDRALDAHQRRVRELRDRFRRQYATEIARVAGEPGPQELAYLRRVFQAPTRGER